MSLKQWAVKPGELRALDDDDLVLFAVRCALRVEPWAPETPLWSTSLARALARTGTLRDARALSDVGADLVNDTDGTADEDAGRCAGYATEALALALELGGVAERPSRVRGAIGVAKSANSIFAVLAHGGRAGVAVDVAAGGAWPATRADLDVVAGAAAHVCGARDPVRALRELAPLWPDDAWPSWSLP